MMDLKNNGLGQIFTPDYVAGYMVKNVKKYYLATHDIENLDQIEVLEPCAGKGVFLDYLLNEGFTNITAYELDQKLKTSLIERYPNVKFKFENFLGANPIDKYDIIIGNPPYLGHNYNANIFQELVRKYHICQKYFVGHMDLFYFFIHLGIIKLKPGALLSYITTHYWITKSKKTGITKIKPHIKNECFLLQYIDFSTLKLFRDAKGQHNCIFVLQKKSEIEIRKNIDKQINILQIGRPNNKNAINCNSFGPIFNQILSGNETSNLLTYQSALSNKDLSRNDCWNLLYPNEIKEIVEKIEKFCSRNNQISYLKDYFIIRNGLILIKDDIFILKENKNVKFEKNLIYIKIQGKFVKLSEDEGKRLKKIYKSNAIRPYSYDKSKYTGFLIYFNKEEFESQDIYYRNKSIEIKYPNLTKYLSQYKEQIEEILINAKENTMDIYFPRRGSFIIQYNEFNKRYLTNLEPYYDNFPKIFLKYISESIIFGYTKDSYYATSDTYFLWPNNMQDDLDYLFLIAYLNSKLVKFLFKAKNIIIKRSKTNWENLPIPNLKEFEQKEDLQIINLIKFFTSITVHGQTQQEQKELIENSLQFNQYKKYMNSEFVSQIEADIKEITPKSIQKIIDSLFFQLFRLDEKLIVGLLKKFYNF